MEILTARIRAVLLQRWDPIGIADEPAALDEYDTYIPEIRRMLAEGADVDRLAAFLSDAETRSMGLAGDLARARSTAEALRALNRRT